MSDVITAENKLFKWVFPILFGVLFTLIGILYGFLRSADADASSKIENVQNEVTSYKSANDLRFQNLEWNVYIQCINNPVKLDCKKPESIKI